MRATEKRKITTKAGLCYQTLKSSEDRHTEREGGWGGRKQRKHKIFTEDNKQISLKTRATESRLCVKACWLCDSVPSPSPSPSH